MKVGDRLFCYVSGVSAFVLALIFYRYVSENPATFQIVRCNSSSSQESISGGGGGVAGNHGYGSRGNTSVTLTVLPSGEREVSTYNQIVAAADPLSCESSISPRATS